MQRLLTLVRHIPRRMSHIVPLAFYYFCNIVIFWLKMNSFDLVVPNELTQTYFSLFYFDSFNHFVWLFLALINVAKWLQK